MKRMGGLALAFMAVAGCSKSEPSKTAEATAPVQEASKELVVRSYRAMGTQITITVYTDAPQRVAGVCEEVFRELDRLERLLTVWRPNSDVSRINRAAGQAPVEVSEETLFVIERAVALGRATAGKFDITFGALSGLWKFDHDQDDKIPDPKDVKARLPLVDYQQIVFDKETRTVRLKKAGMKMHLGGIGKGYGVDRAVVMLREAGFSDFMIQAGGDMYVAGTKGDRSWRVGIRDPRDNRNTFFAAAEVTDATFSTSGDYERFFIKDGVRYHHILDPATGRPATGTRSVTIMAPDALTADALSTGVLILGPEQGLKVIESMPDVGAVIVDDQNRVHVSKRLEGKIKRFKNPTDGL